MPIEKDFDDKFKDFEIVFKLLLCVDLIFETHCKVIE